VLKIQEGSLKSGPVKEKQDDCNDDDAKSVSSVIQLSISEPCSSKGFKNPVGINLYVKVAMISSFLPIHSSLITPNSGQT